MSLEQPAKGGYVSSHPVSRYAVQKSDPQPVEIQETRPMSEAVAKTIRSFLIGLAGAALAYVGTWASGADFGMATVWLVPLISSIVDLLRRQVPVEAISGNKQ